MTAKRRPAVLERALRRTVLEPAVLERALRRTALNRAAAGGGRPAGTESAYERTREKEQNP